MFAVGSDPLKGSWWSPARRGAAGRPKAGGAGARGGAPARQRRPTLRACNRPSAQAAVKMIKPSTDLALARNAMGVDAGDGGARSTRRPRRAPAASEAQSARVTCEPAFDAFARATPPARSQVVVAAAGRRPGDAGLGLPEGRARPALQLPVRVGRRRRLARPLLVPGDGARPGLALPRRRGRDRRGRRHRRGPLPPRRRWRAGVAARPGRRARGSSCRAACRRWPPACSA